MGLNWRDAAKERCEKATHGPWAADTLTAGDCVVWAPNGDFLTNIGSSPFGPVTTWEELDKYGEVTCFDGEKQNCEFIAHTRTDLPRALALLERCEQFIGGLVGSGLTANTVAEIKAARLLSDLNASE